MLIKEWWLLLTTQQIRNHDHSTTFFMIFTVFCIFNNYTNVQHI